MIESVLEQKYLILTGTVQKILDAQHNSIECYKKAHRNSEISLRLLMVSRKCQDIQTCENTSNPLQE
jgi:hypothetical protein